MTTEIDLNNYRKDAHGRLVPVESISDIDLARDELVKEIVAGAKKINALLREFRLKTHADIEALVELSAEKYDVTIGGKKGNLSLLSFDGKYRVQRAISETLGFDERLQAAKELVDQCLNEWSENARPEIRTLILDAFQVDKEGRINTKRVLSLRRLDIKDEKWKRAMEAISDSLSVAISRQYIRIYERDEEGRYNQINLDLPNA